ncbi:MAG: hypothetical protein BWY82_01013 [Verrucomicrobia bacterium ADurb.Bin474]|nr:MAG: hypothetical protein BWY82_01013 [Verrucomicrobia bacterium ADurb.Bin474]
MRSSANPMTPFSGVRISWLMLARNSDFARFAASATSFAMRRLASVSLRSVMSLWVPAIRHAQPFALRSASPRERNHRHDPSLARMRNSMENRSMVPAR